MGYQKPEQGDASENNAVIPEGLEIVVSNIAKKKANTIDADQIGKDHGKKKHEPFRPRKVSSMFKKFQKAGSRHHRDTEEERELRCGNSSYRKKHCSDNRGTGTGGSRNQRQALEKADLETQTPGKILHFRILKIPLRILILYQ